MSADKKSDDDGTLGCLLVIFAVPISLLHGKILSDMWSWFVVPQFGVKPLPFAIAAGLILIYSLLRAKPGSSKDVSGSDLFVYNIIVPLVVWVMAWLIWRFWV